MDGGEVELPAAASGHFQRVRPEPEALDEALDLILGTNRPVLLAGRGAVRSGARDAIVALADHLGAPVSASLLASGLFTGHPLDLGISGTVATSVGIGRMSSWPSGRA